MQLVLNTWLMSVNMLASWHFLASVYTQKSVDVWSEMYMCIFQMCVCLTAHALLPDAAGRRWPLSTNRRSGPVITQTSAYERNSEPAQSQNKVTSTSTITSWRGTAQIHAIKPHCSASSLALALLAALVAVVFQSASSLRCNVIWYSLCSDMNVALKTFETSLEEFVTSLRSALIFIT